MPRPALWLALLSVIGAVLSFGMAFVLAGDDRSAAAFAALVTTVGLCFLAIHLVKRPS